MIENNDRVKGRSYCRQFVPSIAEMDAMLPAPKAAVGRARSAEQARHRNIEVLVDVVPVDIIDREIEWFAISQELPIRGTAQRCSACLTCPRATVGSSGAAAPWPREDRGRENYNMRVCDLVYG